MLTEYQRIQHAKISDRSDKGEMSLTLTRWTAISRFTSLWKLRLLFWDVGFRRRTIKPTTETRTGIYHCDMHTTLVQGVHVHVITTALTCTMLLKQFNDRQTDRHTFNSLSSRTTWVSRHHKGPFTHMLRFAVWYIAVQSTGACFSIMNIHM